MEVIQLRYFLKVAERHSFTRAAAELGLSQSALSRAIARLEQEFGQPLFERQTRRVALTDAGRLLQPRAAQILQSIDDTKSEIMDDGQSGTIRLGAIPTIAPYLLPELLQQFAAKFPKATVQIREDVTDRLLQRCNHGEVDVAILAAPVRAPYLEVEILFEEELLLLTPREHPLARAPRVTIADLRPYPFVLLDEAHCLTGSVESFCHQRSFHPISVEVTNQLATVQELVALGHGISLIPEMARRRDASKHRHYRSLSGPKPTRKIAVVWNPYRFQSRLMNAFREQLRQFTRDA